MQEPSPGKDAADCVPRDTEDVTQLRGLLREKEEELRRMKELYEPEALAFEEAADSQPRKRHLQRLKANLSEARSKLEAEKEAYNKVYDIIIKLFGAAGATFAAERVEKVLNDSENGTCQQAMLQSQFDRDLLRALRELRKAEAELKTAEVALANANHPCRMAAHLEQHCFQLLNAVQAANQRLHLADEGETKGGDGGGYREAEPPVATPSQTTVDRTAAALAGAKAALQSLIDKYKKLVGEDMVDAMLAVARDSPSAATDERVIVRDFHQALQRVEEATTEHESAANFHEDWRVASTLERSIRTAEGLAEQFPAFMHAAGELTTRIQHLHVTSENRGLASQARAVREVKANLTGHAGPVYSIAWHPNANLLASGSEDQLVKLWRPENECTPLASCGLWTCLATLRGHSDAVNSVSWHPSADVLASGSEDKNIRLWVPAANATEPLTICRSWTCVATLAGHGDSVFSVAWCPRETVLVSASGDETLKVWVPEDTPAPLTPYSAWACQATIVGHTEEVVGVSWHPRVDMLASTSDDSTIKLWVPADPAATVVNCDSWSCLATLIGHDDDLDVDAVQWHPTANVLASASDDGTVKLWAPKETAAPLATCRSWTCLATLRGHNGGILSVSWHPSDDMLAIGFECGDVALWVPANADPVSRCRSWFHFSTLVGHSKDVDGLAWHPSANVLASASSDCKIKLWTAPANPYSEELSTLLSQLCAVFHP